MKIFGILARDFIITALTSVVAAFLMRVIFPGTNPWVIGLVGGVFGFLISSFIIQFLLVRKLKASVQKLSAVNFEDFVVSSRDKESQQAEASEAPVEEAKQSDGSVQVAAVEPPVEAAKPVIESVPEVVSKAAEDKKPEPVAPVSSRVIIKKKGPRNKS